MAGSEHLPSSSMLSLREGYSALVIGASGALTLGGRCLENASTSWTPADRAQFVTPGNRYPGEAGPYLRRSSAARACACRPSPCASTEAIRPRLCAPCSLTSIRLERFWKS